MDDETMKVLLRKYYDLKKENIKLKKRIVELEDEIKILQRWVK